MGTAKLDPKDLMYLESCEFPLDGLATQHPLIRAVNSEEENQRDPSDSQEEGDAGQVDPEVYDIASDVQPDTTTALIGWDFSNGDPGDRPHPGLVRVALADYLRVRGASEAYSRLSALGIEEPNDLQFLYLEDLLESGFSRSLAERVMIGIHPPGTRRPDNPQLCNLTSGEVRILDRAQRPIPWVIQNRSLTERCPGPPLAGLGCRQPDARRGAISPRAEQQELRAPDPSRFPGDPHALGTPRFQEEPGGADPTDSSPPRSIQEPSSSSGEPRRTTHAAERAVEDYQYMMYMQAMWGDDEWDPSSTLSASSNPVIAHSQVPVPTAIQASRSSTDVFDPGAVISEAGVQAPEEPSADPTDSSSPRSSQDYRCMAVQSTGPLESNQVPSDSLHRPVEGLISPDQGGDAQLHLLRREQRGAASVGSLGIGVPIDNPLAAMNVRRTNQAPASVQKVDEAAYTQNVEELLSNLVGPLEVVHNVSSAEVKRHLHKWKSAAQAELQSFESMQVIRKFFGPDARRILQDPGIEVIPGKAVCTVKPADPYKRKFRIVSCGNFASSTLEANVYAGGAGAESLRTLLVHAAQRNRRCYGLDIKSAFLLAPIPSGVTKRYAMKPPRVLVELGLCEQDEIWMIDRALYGFRESPKWWSDHRDRILAIASWMTPFGEVHLKQFTSEGNIWAIRTKDGVCKGHVLVYVDDILVLSDPVLAESFISWIRQRWECTGLKEATTTEPLRFLGVDIYSVENSAGEIVGFNLGQESYIDELLRSHNTRPTVRATAPVPKEWVRDLPEIEEFTESELRAGQSITGELLWLAQRTRIDIGFCVGLMASWVSRFPRQVTKVGSRVLEYLANTKGYRLSLVPGRTDGLRIYTDASFAPFGSHSISGIVLQYHECTVVWKSKRQSLVTLSTAESELCAGCEGVTLAQSLEALIAELEESSSCKNLMVDNTAAVTLAEGGGSVRTRHLRVRAAFLHDMRERGELSVSHCPGDVQLADCLTKALLKSRLEDLNRLVGLGPPVSPRRVARVALETPAPLTHSPQDVQQHNCHLDPAGHPATLAQGCPNGLGPWLLALIILLHLEQVEGADEEGSVAEPLGLELSLMIVLLTMSVLFLWESGKACARACCMRRQDESLEVRMIHADDEGQQARRNKRQEAVRKAIEREVQEGDIRRRAFNSAEGGDSSPRVHSYVHVQVGADSLTSREPPPPPPEAPSRDGFRSSSHGVTGGTAPSSQAPSPPPPPPYRPASPQSDSQVQGQGKGMRSVVETSTQTEPDSGLTFTELCELHVVTTSSRSPGALHLFPTCHALRNVTSTQDRMFCRYCLQAVREGRRRG